MIYVIDEEPSGYQLVQNAYSEETAAITYCQSLTCFFNLQELVRPCCVVTELMVGDEQGCSLLSFLEERCLTIPVIFYTSNMDVDVILRVMEQGALTVVHKSESLERLLDSINSALDTDRRQFELSQIYCHVRNILHRLTERQKEVLRFMVQGYSTKKIADEFRLSQRLVEKERSEILRQFHVAATPDVTLMMGEYRAINDLWNHPRWRVSAHGWPVAS